MTVDSRAIEPGSIPHGERQTLEQNLPAALGGGPSGPGGAAAPQGGSLAIPENPLGALMDGTLPPQGDEPLTAGLSVGPGDGPLAQPDPLMGSRADKLRTLATESSSPVIRNAARNELRRMAREGI